MRVEKLAMMMDLARQVGILPTGGLENNLRMDLFKTCLHPSRCRSKPYLGTIGEFMRSEVDLAEGTFPDQPSEGVVSYISKILRREFSEEKGSC